MRPEQLIVIQSDAIKEDDEYIPDVAKFYLVLNGEFQVKCLKFNKEKKKKHDLYGKKKILDEEKQRNKKLDFSNFLGPGDYFGEVSFLFGCRRTATIKAKQYATLGAVDHRIFTEILDEYPIFRNHLKNNIINFFNDDCKIFFSHALRRVDYLADAKEEILV